MVRRARFAHKESNLAAAAAAAQVYQSDAQSDFANVVIIIIRLILVGCHTLSQDELTTTTTLR